MLSKPSNLAGTLMPGWISSGLAEGLRIMSNGLPARDLDTSDGMYNVSVTRIQ
jgi:hypothetical protein